MRGQSRPAEDGDRAQPPGRRGLAPRLPPDLGAAAGGAEPAAALPGPGLAAAPGADLPPAARGRARQRRVRQEGQEARTRHTRQTSCDSDNVRKKHLGQSATLKESSKDLWFCVVVSVFESINVKIEELYRWGGWAAEQAPAAGQAQGGSLGPQSEPEPLLHQVRGGRVSSLDNPGAQVPQEALPLHHRPQAQHELILDNRGMSWPVNTAAECCDLGQFYTL